MTPEIRVLDLPSIICSVPTFCLSPSDEKEFKHDERQATELVHQIFQGLAVISLGIQRTPEGPDVVFHGQQDLVNLRWAFSVNGLRIGTVARDTTNEDVQSYLIAAVNLNTAEGILLQDCINTVPLMVWQRTTQHRTSVSDKIANTLRRYPISVMKRMENWL